MITYSSEGVKFPNIKKRETSNWIHRVVDSYGKKVGEIGYMFVNDEKILEVNNEYLGHDYYTDIITFDYSEGKVLNGDLVISLDTVFTNAVNGKSWKLQKKKRWPCSKHRQRFCLDSFMADQQLMSFVCHRCSKDISISAILKFQTFA